MSLQSLISRLMSLLIGESLPSFPGAYRSFSQSAANSDDCILKASLVAHSVVSDEAPDSIISNGAQASREHRLLLHHPLLSPGDSSYTNKPRVDRCKLLREAAYSDSGISSIRSLVGGCGDGDWVSHGQKSLSTSASGGRICESRVGRSQHGAKCSSSSRPTHPHPPSIGRTGGVCGSSGPGMKSGDGGATGCSGSPSYLVDETWYAIPPISHHHRLPERFLPGSESCRQKSIGNI
ncbi:hypothetical protein Tco_0653917 [Tanacetum coccineum]|uniref:Uncharacterized protein n=1 Tax=Tanacetum coccineum TaxID=301880 RepID=A0ABQ4X237_9ASTR